MVGDRRALLCTTIPRATRFLAWLRLFGRLSSTAKITLDLYWRFQFEATLHHHAIILQMETALMAYYFTVAAVPHSGGEREGHRTEKDKSNCKSCLGCCKMDPSSFSHPCGGDVGDHGDGRKHSCGVLPGGLLGVQGQRIHSANCLIRSTSVCDSPAKRVRPLFDRTLLPHYFVRLSCFRFTLERHSLVPEVG